MIKLIGDIRPHQITGVALSGGVDSMALLSFLRNKRPKAVTAYFYDHGTKASRIARQFVTDYCHKEGIDLNIGILDAEKPKRDSWEEFWRDQRYDWLFEQACILNERFIATAHHLNDVAETYVWGMAHGNPRFIHYRKPGYFDSPIIRPLLLTPKSELEAWCKRHSVPYIQDESNSNVSFTRNRIRHNIVPEMLQVNPGFLKSVEKAWRNFFNYEE